MNALTTLKEKKEGRQGGRKGMTEREKGKKENKQTRQNLDNLEAHIYYLIEYVESGVGRLWGLKNKMPRNLDNFLVDMLIVVVSGEAILKPISMKYGINQMNKCADGGAYWDVQFSERKKERSESPSQISIK